MEAATSTMARRAVPRPQRGNEGHGRRLTEAFEALEAFPALVESRNRLLKLTRDRHGSTGDIVSAVESDVALAIAVLRIANRAKSPQRGKIASVPAAVDVLGAAGIEALASRAAVFDFFERSAAWDAAPERFRLHALSAQRAADRLVRELPFDDRDELLISALLHDVGKLVLEHAYAGYPVEVHAAARTPEERIRSERLELGVDHALVGGVLARRWGLPARMASAIERHHADDAHGEAAVVRMSDMLAHYGNGLPIDSAQLLKIARTVGLSSDSLRAVMYDLPGTGSAGLRRRVEPCPLSAREIDVLRELAEGKVYKQIASDLNLSTSTVRTHLHNTYGKLGAVDRAQAVLLATERGWI